MQRSLIAVSLGLLSIALPAGSASPAEAAPSNADRELQQVKAATARFHSLEQARRAGYLAPPPGACVASPLGGMGYHFENPTLMRDSVLDPRRPEILLYERRENGRFRLVGVEYYMEADRVAAAPVLFGQTFQGPMPAHHPGMETHYDLHAWLWKPNPSGMFAEWNPSVSCP